MIIVKSIKEKPEECRGCKLFNESTYDCLINSESPAYTTCEEQYEHCPIEEAPDINVGNIDAISRQAAIDALLGITAMRNTIPLDSAIFNIKKLPSAQPDASKYEYHYDHTDCIWYRPEARNRCPVTCAQYRDGWNDAMNYIFRDGKGYRPYRRGEQYEE